MTIGGITLTLVVVEDHVVSSSSDKEDGSSASMERTSVWQRMPLDLVETVLLYLPPSSQARFRSVCKRWRKLIKSAKFQEEASALRKDCLWCFLQPSGLNSPVRLPGELTVKSLKVHKLRVEMQGLTIQLGSLAHSRNWDVCTHGDLVVVASWNPGASVSLRGFMRCWLLNIANQSWQELPPLVPRTDICVWNSWVAGSNTNNFQVSMITKTSCPWSRRYTLYTCSNTSTTWSSLDILEGVELEPERCAFSKLGYILVDPLDRVWLWDPYGTSCASPTPLPSQRNIQILSHPDTDAVFGYSCFGLLKHLKLFRLDGSSGQWKWKCVVSRLPQGCVLDDIGSFEIRRAKIVGNKVLIEVWLKKKNRVFSSFQFRGCRFLTYHILSSCYEWHSALSHQEFDMDWESNINMDSDTIQIKSSI